MKKIANLIALGFVVSTVACSQPDASYEGSSDLQTVENVTSESEVTEDKNIPTKELKIIKEGDLEFESTDLAQTRAKINEAVKTTGAYISNESVSSSETRSQQRLEIRVPVENFDTLVDKISEGVVQFENKNIRVLDEKDPRKEEYIRDMIRIQNDMREVRQELEIREMMIIKRESLFREKFPNKALKTNIY